jgi:hypothetical protein
MTDQNRAALSSSEPSALPDAGEPQGARDDRPTMLGRHFRRTLLTGGVIGVLVALAGHYLITQTLEDSTKFNGWSWAFAAVGGFAVGGALSLFIYGAATDRSDLEHDLAQGTADVSQEGEWARTVSRRRRARRRR